MQAPAVASRPPLGLALTIVDGRALLTVAPGDGAGGLGRIDRLALEVPGLRFPFDLSAGARGFSHRRCRVVELAYSVAAAELEALLAAAPLARFGLSDPAVVLLPDGLRLGVRASVSGRAAELSAKISVSALPGGLWRIALGEARLHGYVPVPAPLLLGALPAALGLVEGEGAHWGMSPPALVRARGLTEWDVDVAELALTAGLAGAGWRVPGREGLASGPVTLLDDGRLGFNLEKATGAGAEAEDAAFAALAHESPVSPVAERGLAALAEATLAAGELRAAAEGFRRALAVEAENDFARERLFQLLASARDGLVELESRADETLAARPGFGLGLLAKAVAAAESGRRAEAASLYDRLATAAERAGEPLDEAAARIAAAEQWAEHDVPAAITALERALLLRPGHPAATAALAGLRTGAA